MVMLSYIIMALLAPLSLVGNGCVLIAILTNRALRKNDGLYLWTALSMADFFLALFLLPYIAYLIIGSNLDINYDPKWMIVLNLPVVTEIKINSILTMAIAFDRLSAFVWPVAYKSRHSGYYALASTAVATTWGLLDAGFCYLTAPFVPKGECGAAGCFMNETFRYYWGVSDMFVNAIVMVITVSVLYKIRKMRTISQEIRYNTSHYNNSNNTNNQTTSIPTATTSSNLKSNNVSERPTLDQANQITVSVLLCSGICIFLPSMFAGLGELFGLTVFGALGPFVAVGLLACGVGNAFIFIFQHTIIRNSIYEIGKKLKMSIIT